MSLALGSLLLAVQILGANGEPNPAYAALHAWYDASDGVNGPGQPPDGSAVHAWLDRSVAGHPLDSASPSPPTFRAGQFGARPAVVFRGDGWIRGDRHRFGLLPREKTAFFVLRVDPLDFDDFVFDSAEAGASNSLVTGHPYTTSFRWQVGAGLSLYAYGPPVVRGRPLVVAAIYGDGRQELFLDGVLRATGSLSLSAMAGCTLGARFTESQRFHGAVAEVLFYASALGAAEREAIEGYLRGKYALAPGLSLATASLTAGQSGTCTVSQATPGASVVLGFSLRGPGPTTFVVPRCARIGIELDVPVRWLATAVADGAGVASWTGVVPASAAGLPVWLQALELGSCRLSNGTAIVVG